MNLTTTALLAVRLSLLRWLTPNLLRGGACGPNLPSGASLGLRTMYLPTLVSPMSMSSFRSPPWMPGVLQSGSQRSSYGSVPWSPLKQAAAPVVRNGPSTSRTGGILALIGQWLRVSRDRMADTARDRGDDDDREGKSEVSSKGRCGGAGEVRRQAAQHRRIELARIDSSLNLSCACNRTAFKGWHEPCDWRRSRTVL